MVYGQWGQPAWRKRYRTREALTCWRAGLECSAVRASAPRRLCCIVCQPLWQQYVSLYFINLWWFTYLHLVLFQLWGSTLHWVLVLHKLWGSTCCPGCMAVAAYVQDLFDKSVAQGDLAPTHQCSLAALLRRHSDAFATGPMDLGYCSVLEHRWRRTDLTDSTSSTSLHSAGIFPNVRQHRIGLSVIGCVIMKTLRRVFLTEKWKPMR